MYPTIITLIVYSIFRHMHTNSEKVYCLHHGCLSLCQHISQRLALDEFSLNLTVGLYGNLSIYSKFGWSRSNMSAIATTTSQSHDCGHDQVTSVVLRLVQCCVHFHYRDSEGRLLAA